MIIHKRFDFKAVSSQTLKQLEEQKHMVLSLRCGNDVTSKIIATSCCGKRIFFLACNAKSFQIKENPRVHFYVQKFQIEGIAIFRGSALETSIDVPLELCLEKQNIAGMEVIEVEIKSIQWFGQEGTHFFLERINFETESVYREIASWKRQFEGYRRAV
jgi:hypothetical protein